MLPDEVREAVSRPFTHKRPTGRGGDDEQFNEIHKAYGEAVQS